MRHRFIAGSLMALVTCSTARSQEEPTTAFTYQGQVTVSDQPLSGTADFRWRLYDDSDGGSQVSSQVDASGVEVTNGVFTAPVDFGPSAYETNGPKWIELDIRHPPGGGDFTTLTPRQRLTPTPFALNALTLNLPYSGSGGAAGCLFDITNTLGNAICGHSTAPSGTQYGVFGTAISPDGVGVFGSANTGVQGVSTTGNGNGVSGYASGGPDAWGVAGETATGQAVTGRAGTALPGGGFPGGTGVVGYSNVPGAFGVWAQVTDANAVGLTASNIATSGNGVGIRSYSQSNSNGAMSIAGIQVAPTGITVGVYGEVASNSGWGVYGNATSTTGNANGVWGNSVSPNGTGTIGVNTAATGLAAGVHGFSSSTSGGAGVVGSNYMPTGQTYGVYGESSSTSGYGVYGTNSGGLGVGVYGYSPLSTGTIGVSDGTAGIGVYGGADSPTGTTYAIYGSTLSPTGWSGYFQGGQGVYVGNSLAIGMTAPTHPLHLASGAHCTAGGTFVNASSRKLKENFADTDARSILSRVAVLSIRQWNYRNENESVRHIGPVAEEFYDAFELGGDDQSIGTVDADGIALAAIQGLHQIVQEKDCEIAELKERLEKIEARLSE